MKGSDCNNGHAIFSFLFLVPFLWLPILLVADIWQLECIRCSEENSANANEKHEVAMVLVEKGTCAWEADLFGLNNYFRSALSSTPITDLINI